MSRSLFLSLAAVAAVSVTGAAHSAILIYGAEMLGSSEVPPTGSEASGFTRVTIDTVLNSMLVDVSYSDVTTTPGAAHIHCCIAPGSSVGVAVGFPGFPSTLSGTYSHLFDLTDPTIYTANFRNNFGGGTAAGAQAALLAGLASGQAYSNIHNSTFQNGEIRGLLTAVPEPGAWALMLTGFGLTGATLRRRRRQAVVA